MATIIENNGDAGAEPDNTSYSIALGDVFQGMLDTVDDRDLVQIELSADTIYDVRLQSDAAPAKLNDLEKFIQLVLYDSVGDQVFNGSHISYGSLLIFQPPVSGTYYIGVHSPYKGVSGDYEVTVIENTIPVGTYDEIAAYLTDGYWEWWTEGGSGAAFDISPGGRLTADITALSENIQPLARWALEAWTNVTGIKFEFVDDENANIVFTDEDEDHATGGFTSLSATGDIISSKVNMPASIPPDEDDISDFMSVFIHEIGHALGLGHPGPYPSFNEDIVTVFGFENLFLLDAEQRTIMSYVYDNTYINASRTTAVTPMIVDIIAIQNLYGVPADINIGDTVYGYRSNLDGYLGYTSTLLAGDSRNPFFNIAETPFSYPELADLDSDGDLDLIIGINHLNDEGTQYIDYTIDYYENTGSITDPVFTVRTGENNPLDSAKSFINYKPVLADLDGDGDFDLIIGNLYYYENTGSVTVPEFMQRTGADNPLQGVSTETLRKVILPDLDGDGDLDLVTVNNDGNILYFQNNGTVTAPEFTQRTGETNPFEEIEADESGGSPVFRDLDDDGDLDLIIGRVEGAFDYYENTGTTNSPEFTLSSDTDSPFNNIRPVYQGNPVLSDLDGDGDLDLISGGLSGTVYYFENVGSATTPDFNELIQGGRPISMTLYDNGGVDTLDLRTDRNDQIVDLRPEGISNVYGLRGNLIIARDTIIENYVGGAGNDTVTGNDVGNVLEGRAGADALDGGAGSDTAAYTGSPDAVTINLSDGTIMGGHADGDSYASIENLIGTAHDDTLIGDTGDNVLEGYGGVDNIDGGEGSDTAAYTQSGAAITVNLADGTFTGGHAEGDTLTSIENLTGSRYNDTLTGDASANRLEGGPGHDLLIGGAGADALVGGAGSDTASYTGSDVAVSVSLTDATAAGGHAEGDTLAFIENLIGSAHDDTLTGDSHNNVLEGGAGADILDGGAGIDTASYADSDSRVDVRLSGTVVNHGDATGDALTSIENLTGSAHNDTLAGDGQDNILTGNAGNDLLWGSGGDDLLAGGPGADRFQGGNGQDTVSYSGSAEGVTVRLHGLSASGGDAQGDTFPYRVDVMYTDTDGITQTESLPDVENLTGSAHNDTLAGDRRDNVINGGDGDDTLYGGPGGGDDLIIGGNGSDRLFGGQGDDTLNGGPGEDTLSGGLGTDIFVFGPRDGTDTVIDFTTGADKVDLTAFAIENVDTLTLTTGEDGVALDLTDNGGGTILLAGLTSVPDAGDFLV